MVTLDALTLFTGRNYCYVQTLGTRRNPYEHVSIAKCFGHTNKWTYVKCLGNKIKPLLQCVIWASPRLGHPHS